MRKLIIILLFIFLYRNLNSEPEWIYYSNKNSPMGFGLYNFGIDSSDVKWVISYNGFYLLDSVNWIKIEIPFSNVEIPNIYNIEADGSNNMWLTSLQGLFYFDRTSWFVYNTTNSDLPNDTVTAINFDRNNIKWIGTIEGLVRLDDSKMIIYDTSNSGLPSNLISSIAIDKDNNKWIGTWHPDPKKPKGLVKYDGTNWTVFNKKNSGLVKDDISTLAIDKSNVLWISLQGKGVMSFDGTNWKLYDTTQKYLPNNWIQDIFIDKDNNKWFATRNGLVKFDNSKWETFNQSTGIQINSFYNISGDKKGNLWMHCFNVTENQYVLGVYKKGGVNGGIEEEITIKNEFNISPNPAEDFIEINMNKGLQPIVQGEIGVYDVYGRCVMKNNPITPFDKGELKIDVSGLVSGLYFVRIGDRVQKFVKI